MDVTLVLTHDCNLGCGYCYAGAKFARAMSPRIARKAVELAFASGSGRVEVSFFGGEPLLAWDQLVASARHARERAATCGTELRLCVTTNGTLLDDERARVLSELDVYVGLSIDGVREAHDAGRPRMGGGSSFDDVERGLDVLVRLAKPFETISVVTPANVRWLGESVRWLAARGVPRLGINPCYEAAFTDEQLAQWEKGLEDAAEVMIECYRAGRVLSIGVFDNKIMAAIKGGLAAVDRCSLGERSVAVAPSGNLYGCERLVAEDDDPTHVIGHVDSGGIRPRGDACVRGPANPECEPCGERWRCSSSCACANLAETGRTDLAGGTQCWHERTTGRIADSIAATLWGERNVPFLAWFYGRMGPEESRPALATSRPPKEAPLGMVARSRTGQTGRLRVVP